MDDNDLVFKCACIYVKNVKVVKKEKMFVKIKNLFITITSFFFFWGKHKLSWE